jgi:hypothetical protein
MDFVTNVSLIIPYKGIAFVSENPKISWNNDRLHNESAPAVEYADGYGLCSLNGVTIDKELFEKIPKMKAKDVFAIKNTEQRRVVYETMDKTKLKALKPKVLSKAKDGPYWMKVVELTLDDYEEPFRYLNCKDPSTGREYFLETEETDCVKAKAKSFGLEQINFKEEW